MKRIIFIVLTLAFAAFLAACGAPATNAVTNTAIANANAANANAAKPVAAAPIKEALFAMDKEANEAYLNGDAKFFEGFLSDKFVMVEGGQRMGKAEVVKMIASGKCEIKDWKLEDPQMSTINADTAVLSYKGTFDGTCTGPDGKAMKLPSPVRAATVWVRNGDKWKAVFHGENLIFDPKNPPKAAPAPPAKQADKKDESKPAAPAPDPSTDAMMAVEKSVWEAWKAKDAKKLEDLLAKDVSFVNIFGTYFANKADAMKDWTGGNCEIKSVNVTDGVGTSLTPTTGILTVKGTADGICDGQNVGGATVYGTSVYVKDGDAWKWAFGFNSPAS